MATSLSTAKSLIRKQVRFTLKQMSAEEMERQSNYIQKQVVCHPKFESSRRIAFYLNLNNEVNTTMIMAKCFEANKLCFIPKYKPGSREMSMVRLKSIADYESLPVTKWNIKQPSEDEKREQSSDYGGLDLMIVPAMAFTKEGFRLGKGGGYYDSFLFNLNQSNQQFPYLIGLAFKEQMLTELPIDSHDFKVNEVITTSALHPNELD